MRKSKLEIIIAQIRKDIPRLMELREGLVFQFKDRVLKVLYKYDETRWKCVDTFGVQGKFPDEVINKESKIIGHEIMLNDVLGWVSIKQGRYVLLPRGEFISIKYEENEYDIERTFVYWNLSSPYLKDQSEELIEFLYSLIEQ